MHTNLKVHYSLLNRTITFENHKQIGGADNLKQRQQILGSFNRQISFIGKRNKVNVSLSSYQKQTGEKTNWFYVAEKGEEVE